MCVRATSTSTVHQEMVLPKFTVEQKLLYMEQCCKDIVSAMKDVSVLTLVDEVLGKLKTQCCNVFSFFDRKIIDKFEPMLLNQVSLFLAQYEIDIPALYDKAILQNDVRVPDIVAEENGQLKNSIYGYFLHFDTKDIKIIEKLNKDSYLLKEKGTIQIEINADSDVRDFKESLISLLEAYLEIIQYYDIDTICLINTYIKLKMAGTKCGLFFSRG